MVDRVVAERYYDSQVGRKLQDFVSSNARVDRAWETVTMWAPSEPRRILEVGCGVGGVCWRMSRRWPQAQIVGVDLSSRAVEMARALFGSPTLRFQSGPLLRGTIDGTFDLIVLIDVYEHIPLLERPAFHQALRELCGDGCHIILTFPTPRHLQWLRTHRLSEIQPVDEYVDAGSMLAVAVDTMTSILMYQEVGAWRWGDYAHCVLRRGTDWPQAGSAPRTHRLCSAAARVWRRLAAWPSRTQRARLVRGRLGTKAILELREPYA